MFQKLCIACSGVVLGAIAVEIYLAYHNYQKIQNLEKRVNEHTLLLEENSKKSLPSTPREKEIYQEFNDKHESESKHPPQKEFYFGPQKRI